MRSFLRVLVVVVVVLATSIIGPNRAAYSNEVDAKIFAQNASERIYKLYNQIADSIYNSEDGDDFEALFSKIVNVKVIAKELVEISKEAQKFDIKKITDPQLKSALYSLRLVGDLFVLDEEYFTGVLLNLSSLMEIGNDKDIEPYNGGTNTSNCNESSLAYFPDIQNIFGESTDAEELKYYWETWREKNRQWAAINFYSIIESMKKAASILDVPLLELWYKYYKDMNFLKEMEKVMIEIRPFYRQLHSFVRERLHSIYGDEVINPRGPIPDHLFQQVLLQAWRNGSIIERALPNGALPPYDKFVSDNGFDASKVLEVADNFYLSLGFSNLSEDYWKNRFKVYSEDQPTGDCKADIFDLTPNVYMKYCHQVDFRKLMQAHGYMGRMHYVMEKKDLPAYFFDSYDLQYPVGEAVVLSASTPKHLTTIGLASNYNFTDDVLMNRLFRMGIHTMFNIPIFFVHTKVMNDLLNETVEMEGLNKHYWKLMEEYAGVEPPVDRPDSSLDFPHKFYTEIDENYQTRKFVSEVLGYQFYRAICKKYTQTDTLHNCDFYNSKEAGDAIKEMMSLGSSKPWREVISKLLPENPSLSADGLLEYYDPLLSWLKKHNNHTHNKVGWNHSRKKIL